MPDLDWEDLKDEFATFPDEVRTPLIEAVCLQSAHALRYRLNEKFTDKIKGLPDYAFDWMIKFEKHLIGEN